MIDPLQEPGYLTADQRKVVEAPGDIVLTACPGSGKTRTAAARFVVRAHAGARIAATSYTNVGVDEFRREVTGELGAVVGDAHFVGTLHGLLLRFVFHPFAHLVMDTSAAPVVVDPDAVHEDVVLNGDNRLRVSVAGFRFRPDGTLCFGAARRPRGWSDADVTAVGRTEALRRKYQMARSGRATYDDAMYWALEVLRKTPGVAAAVAGRFDELLIDEAQDTSELQLACLEVLCATGRLRSLVLVGDVEQSIYSFQGASPQGLEALTRARGLTPMQLVENHRSSRHVCRTTVHFCTRSEADQAIGVHTDDPARPEIFLYDPDMPASAVARFRQRLCDLGIPPEGAAVLARGRELVAEINGDVGSVDCGTRPRVVGRATVALRHATLGRHHLHAVERVICHTAWGSPTVDTIDMDQRRAVRAGAIALLTGAAPLDRPLRTWIKDTAVVLRDVVRELVDEPAHLAGRVLRSTAAQERVLAREFFIAPTSELSAQTVHDVKGVSRDAVLVVARPRGSARHPAEADIWTAHLRGEPLSADQDEERRILFVALTRARRYCAVGLPADTALGTIASFEGAGFRFIGPTSADALRSRTQEAV